MKEKRSRIWHYFDALENKKGRCRYCHAEISILGGSLSNLTRHLRNKHKGLPIWGRSTNSQITSNSLDEEKVEVFNEDDIKQSFEIVLLDDDLELEQTPSESPVEQTKQINQTDTRRVPIPTAKISKTPPISSLKRIPLKPSSEPTLNLIKEAVSSLKEIVQMNNTTVLEDEFTAFGKHIANQLRQLPLVKALQVQDEIHTLITKERIAHCESLNKN